VLLSWVASTALDHRRRVELLEGQRKSIDSFNMGFVVDES
jgi:hypothetical protein